MDDAQNEIELSCPICNAKVLRDNPYMPFCSKRCKMADLNNWFNGTYSISRPIEMDDDLEFDR